MDIKNNQVFNRLIYVGLSFLLLLGKVSCMNDDGLRVVMDEARRQVTQKPRTDIRDFIKSNKKIDSQYITEYKNVKNIFINKDDYYGQN